MPNPFMNIGALSGGQGMAPTGQSPQPQQGPMGPAPTPVMPPSPPQMSTESRISNMLGTTPLAGMMRQSQAASQYQSAITNISNQLRQAQMAGAPPTVVAGLQAQLKEAQDAMRQAGMKEMYSQQMNALNTGYGAGSIGSSSPNPYAPQVRGRDALMNQMIAAMFGMGYGSPSGGPMG